MVSKVRRLGISIIGLLRKINTCLAYLIPVKRYLGWAVSQSEKKPLREDAHKGFFRISLSFLNSGVLKNDAPRVPLIGPKTHETTWKLKPFNMIENRVGFC